jgi:hypothetical protein
VINGVAAAPFLLLVMLISNDEKIMGDSSNGKLARLNRIIDALGRTLQPADRLSSPWASEVGSRLSRLADAISSSG